jgi:hypothetical protein
MSNRGGARPGAGRPKGTKDDSTIKKEYALSILREMVLKEIEPITLALIEKAKTGDIPAIKELYDRAFGKAPQSLTGADGGRLIISFDGAFTHASEEHSE